MSQLVIEGGRQLSGEISVFGSKNAALPLLAASLLTSEPVVLKNVPPILDVERMGEILRAMGVAVDVDGAAHTVTINAAKLDATTVPQELVGTLRGSILLLGALLGRERRVRLPKPGGDIIGSRPIDVHLDAFTQLGAKVTERDQEVEIDGSGLKAGRVILREFSVTATENILLAAASLPGKTTIEIAAAEPHVVALCELLGLMGAKITGAGTHTIVVEGVEKLTGATYTNIPDMLEAGLFILIAAATQSEVRVREVPVDQLQLFFKKLDDIGVAYELSEGWETKIQEVRVRPAELKDFRIQTMPYPGIATDLQAPFSVIATQVTGSCLIHDPMYEGRFRYINELQKMGANAVVCDPHRVIITGPTPLTGRRIPGLDIRAGATLLMAGLVAEGQTIIDEAEHLERGYAQLPERLQRIGAAVERAKL